jgi:hypothetical protein
MARAIVLTLFALLALVAGLEIMSNGFSLGSACSFGIGLKQRELETNAARSTFEEALPKRFSVRNFQCSGGLDLSVRFDLRMANADAKSLMDELDATYSKQQNDRYLFDKHKRRKLVRFPDSLRVEYELPGVQPLYVRKVVLNLPNDESSPAEVSFHGWQF